MGLKSRPLLKSTQLFRTLLVFEILSLFSLHFSLSTFPSLSYALDEGGAITSLEYRSVDRESPLSKSNQYEMNYHLDIWQNVPNGGKLSTMARLGKW